MRVLRARARSWGREERTPANRLFVTQRVTQTHSLAEHAFSLGIERVAAYVNVGNTASERVLERAGFTREGVVRAWRLRPYFAKPS